MRIAALIPAFEEGPRIGAVLAQTRQALPDAALLVVDGGSQDRTRRNAVAAGAEVIGQPGRGYADALQAGYRHLLAQGVDAVVQLDADGQHPPAALPLLLAELGGANWVIGSRAGTATPAPLRRRAGNAALSVAVWLACRARIGDVTSGLWALDARALSAFAEVFPRRVADANVRVMAARAGLRITEVPVAMALRSSGRSMHDGLGGVRNFHRSLGAVWRAAL